MPSSPSGHARGTGLARVRPRPRLPSWCEVDPGGRDPASLRSWPRVIPPLDVKGQTSGRRTEGPEADWGPWPVGLVGVTSPSHEPQPARDPPWRRQ